MKAAFNGVPSLSILDGWWCEGFNGKNGWAIGRTEAQLEDEIRDQEDALALVETLEKEVVPLFYARNEDGLPEAWIQVMKEAIRSCAPHFNTDRMLAQSVDQMYGPLL